MFNQSSERTANFSAMNSTSHTKCIKPSHRTDAKPPSKNRSIKHSVMGNCKTSTPVIPIKEILRPFKGPTEPFCITTILLNGYANNFKPVIADVLFRGYLRQAKLFVVVGFKINRKNFHRDAHAHTQTSRKIS